MTRPAVEIQRPKSRYELMLLEQGDVVEIEGRNHPVRVWCNEEGREILNLVGAGGGESIQWILAHYSDVQAASGKLGLASPEVDICWDSGEGRRIYGIARKFLEEVEIWEKE